LTAEIAILTPLTMAPCKNTAMIVGLNPKPSTSGLRITKAPDAIISIKKF
jgi:hypothetical protein